MARKKKKTRELKTHMGYTEGQEVFFICISDSKLGYGRITDFHMNCSDSDNPGENADAVSIVCLMRGSYQTCYLRDIIDEPTRKHVEKRDAAIATSHRGSRQKKK
jgi:hypothetical protein